MRKIKFVPGASNDNIGELISRGVAKISSERYDAKLLSSLKEEREAHEDLRQIDQMINALEDDDMGVELKVGGLKKYGLCDNKSVIKMLKMERKQIKRFLQRKPNKWV